MTIDMEGLGTNGNPTVYWQYESSSCGDGWCTTNLFTADVGRKTYTFRAKAGSSTMNFWILSNTGTPGQIAGYVYDIKVEREANGLWLLPNNSNGEEFAQNEGGRLKLQVEANWHEVSNLNNNPGIEIKHKGEEHTISYDFERVTPNAGGVNYTIRVYVQQRDAGGGWSTIWPATYFSSEPEAKKVNLTFTPTKDYLKILYTATSSLANGAPYPAPVEAYIDNILISDGHEKSISSASGMYTTHFRQYDARLGRWLSVDPVVKYHESPYASIANNPIWLIDPNGADTTFASDKDKQFVNQFLDKNNANFDRKFKRKVKRLAKSDKNYHFESIKPGDPNLGAGKTTQDSNDPNQIFVYFTKGDSKMNKNPTNGFSPYKALWEETYHAWDVDKGKLDLFNPTGMDEARAWQFASKAPGSKDTYRNEYLPGQFANDYTVNYRIKNASKIRIARWLVNGMNPYYDHETGKGYGGMGVIDNAGKVIGQYHDLPIKN